MLSSSLLKGQEIISGEIVLTINGYLPDTPSRKLNKQSIQIRPESGWCQMLPAEFCCLCGDRTRFWSIQKKVPVCDTCANHYPESVVPDESDWQNLP